MANDFVHFVLQMLRIIIIIIIIIICELFPLAWADSISKKSE